MSGRRVAWLLMPAVCFLFGFILGVVVTDGIHKPDYRCTVKGDDVTCTKVQR